MHGVGAGSHPKYVFGSFSGEASSTALRRSFDNAIMRA